MYVLKILACQNILLVLDWFESSFYLLMVSVLTSPKLLCFYSWDCYFLGQILVSTLGYNHCILLLARHLCVRAKWILRCEFIRSVTLRGWQIVWLRCWTPTD